MTFSDKVKAFNRSLQFTIPLPAHIRAMNPFANKEDPIALRASDMFYDKYYNDNHTRHIILGINPGRFGGGITGIPFTDFKRLRDECDIDIPGQSSHEPSSEFIYKMIHTLGGIKRFYRFFYINSMSPLGFIENTKAGKWVNYNYYDSKELYIAVKPFIIDNIKKQLDFGIYTDEGFCLGKKNMGYLTELNKEYHFFKQLTELPHPRYIVQYKRKEMASYIEEYRQKLGNKLEE